MSRALRQHGFEVEVQEDLGSERLLPVIKEFLNRLGVEAKHALLVLDSCYAGSLLDGAVFTLGAARVAAGRELAVSDASAREEAISELSLSKRRNRSPESSRTF